MNRNKLFNIDSKGRKSIKCVLIGDGGSGKTCLLFRYTTGRFPGDKYIPTVMDNYTADIKIKQEPFVLDIWDTAGQEGFEQIRQLSYNNASVFIICYSVDSNSSLKNVETVWLPEVFEQGPGVPFILCGTKLDLCDNPEASLSDAEKLKQKYNGFASVQCSAKLGDNVKQVFDRAIKCVYQGGQKPDTKGRFGKKGCVLF